jgi:ketosteroid isomerase-like protein
MGGSFGASIPDGVEAVGEADVVIAAQAGGLGQPADPPGRALDEPLTSPRPDDPLTLCSALYDALGRGDIPGLEALLDPGFQARLTPGLPWGLGEKPIDGPEAMIVDGWGVVARELDVRDVPERSWVVDDVVVVVGVYRGKARRTDRAMEAWFVHIWRIRTARFVELKQVTDTAAWWNAIGPGT